MVQARATSIIALALGMVGVPGIPVPAALAQAAPNSTASTAAVSPAGEVPQRQQPRPNVLVWMMDDVGFGQLSTYGGLVPTPNIDRVAKRGLVYNNYHTTPICSASRAALLNGRNSHSVNMGGHANGAFPVRGYNARIPDSAGSLAENLKQAGYATFAIGKWDHLPNPETSPVGPFRQWPLGRGFERFYGFLSYDTDNFRPTLTRDNSPIPTPNDPDYHLSKAMADEAIAAINARDARPRPFFVYWSTGAAHAPHHAPKEWREKFRGKFDMGWDAYRRQVLKNQIALGLVPTGTKLPQRTEEMPAWSSLSRDAQKLFARQMEAFAAQLAYTDHEFGRILDELERRGELDNTMIVVTSDNGASAESGPRGLMNEAYVSVPDKPSVEQMMPFLDAWGGPDTFPGYSLGWTVAGNTPLQYYKQTTYEGGIRVPLVVSYPGGFTGGGALREDFVHVSDIAPTIMDVAGVDLAKVVNNAAQVPMDGTSVAASFTANGSPRDARPQYFEMYGNTGLTWQGWSIVTKHRVDTWNFNGPPTFDEPWQLFDIVNDPGQTKDLAAKYPARVKQMAALFAEQAERFHVLPLHNFTAARDIDALIDGLIASRGGRWRYTGHASNMQMSLAPPINFRSYRATATFDMPGAGKTGPIFAFGGKLGGQSLYLDQGRPAFAVTDLEGRRFAVVSDTPLPVGTNEVVLDLSKGQTLADERTEYAVTLSANGKRIADSRIAVRIPAVYISLETFDIGIDQATTVMADYPSSAPLDVGALDVNFDFNR